MQTCRPQGLGEWSIDLLLRKVRVECALILDASQHLDVCNFNNLEQFVQDYGVLRRPLLELQHWVLNNGHYHCATSIRKHCALEEAPM